MKSRFMPALCALIFVLPANAQEGDVSWKSTEIAPGLYMLEGQGGFAGGNLGLLTGDDGTVLIDDGLEPLTAMTVAAVESLTGAPVDFVINTHAHGDHVGANATLHNQGATVVAHENLRRQMARDDAARDALPELTYTDSVTFHLNGYTAEVMHVSSAHTDGDSIIHFPEVNVIHTGDAMFNGLFPFIDMDSGGSLGGYIAAQKQIIAMANDATKIIPGHGPLASKADLQASVDMLEACRELVWELVVQGKTADEVVAENPLAGYGETWNWGFITTERMTRQIYRALTTF
ncbi:MAG: MBL fold metallo-hydrolase [Woeseiaceae bacterium]|nr:MBL fold metallo-hydrolase [Woeseiaceae bacterium]